jgi:hypothetical protein|tara:strand:+ start:43 stop:393 length:351 start_codon:yes stop_codon:yes gene_type:complete
MPNYNNFNQNYGAQFRPEDVRGYNTRRDAGGQIFESPGAMQPLLNQNQMQAAALRSNIPLPSTPISDEDIALIMATQQEPMQQTPSMGNRVRDIVSLASAPGLIKFAYDKFKNRGN